jgi:arabinogalactan endo-1,4-beta-galactosidase
MDIELFGCSDYLPECSHSTMNYRKVMTKLNENNVTYVIQTMASMNYFDSSRKNLTYILNYMEMHAITQSLIFIFAVVFLHS